MFDMTNSHRPEPPQIDRDVAALAVQNELGRPLMWSEYVKVWNACTERMGLCQVHECGKHHHVNRLPFQRTR